MNQEGTYEGPVGELLSLKEGTRWSIEGAAQFAEGLDILARALRNIDAVEGIDGVAVQAGKAAAAKLAGQMDDSKAWVTQITDLVATANDQADAAHHEYNNLPSGQPDESLLVKTGQFLTGPVIGSVWSQMDRQDAAQARIDAAKAAVDKIATNIADTTSALDLALRYPPTIGGGGTKGSIDGLVPRCRRPHRPRPHRSRRPRTTTST